MPNKYPVKIVICIEWWENTIINKATYVYCKSRGKNFFSYLTRPFSSIFVAWGNIFFNMCYSLFFDWFRHFLLPFPDIFQIFPEQNYLELNDNWKSEQNLFYGIYFILFNLRRNSLFFKTFWDILKVNSLKFLKWRKMN